MSTVSNSNNRPIVLAENEDKGIGVAIDYTDFYDRIATAFETIANNSSAIINGLASIETQLTTMANQTTIIADQTTIIADQTTTIADQTTTIAAQQSTIATKITSLEDQATDKNKGIHIIAPWEWLGMSAIVKLYDEKGVNYDELKTRVEQISRSG